MHGPIAERAKQRSRISYIDGLRAIAVLSVIACHAALPLPSGVAVILLQGRHGVELFFVLSGFCLSYATLASASINGGRADFNVARYAAARIVRILPSYYIAFAGFAMVAALLHLRAPVLHYPESAQASLAQVLLFPDFTSDPDKYLNGSFWTLPIEFRWYFVFPVALWTWLRARVLFWSIVAAALAISQRSADALYLPAFLLGIVSAQLHVEGYKVGFGHMLAFAAAATLTITLGIMGWSTQIPAELAAFGLVVLVGSDASVRRLCEARALVAVGIASYSIYLVHQPVILLLERNGVAAIPAAAGAVGAGALFWYLAERPFVHTALSDRWTAMLVRLAATVRTRTIRREAARRAA